MVNLTKKWDQRRPLFLQQNENITQFLPHSHSRSQFFPGITVSHSLSRQLGMEFFIHVPKNWDWNFSFPFQKFGNGLRSSRSRSQSLKVIPAHPWGEAPARKFWPSFHQVLIPKISQYILKSYNICMFSGQILPSLSSKSPLSPSYLSFNHHCHLWYFFL